MRLIDADAFFNDFPELRDYEYTSQEYEVDAEPVVRCKDCVHCADDWINVVMGTMPQFTCELGMCGESVTEHDYCSWGERREDE